MFSFSFKEETAPANPATRNMLHGIMYLPGSGTSGGGTGIKRAQGEVVNGTGGCPDVPIYTLSQTSFLPQVTFKQQLDYLLSCFNRYPISASEEEEEEETTRP